MVKTKNVFEILKFNKRNKQILFQEGGGGERGVTKHAFAQLLLAHDNEPKQQDNKKTKACFWFNQGNGYYLEEKKKS